MVYKPTFTSLGGKHLVAVVIITMMGKFTLYVWLLNNFPWKIHYKNGGYSWENHLQMGNDFHVYVK